MSFRYHKYPSPMDFNRVRLYQELEHEEVPGQEQQLSEPTTFNPINAYFISIEKHIIAYIKNATYIVGCLAWLTNMNILDTLKMKAGVKIIVNKEAYLNPELDVYHNTFHEIVRTKYNELPDLTAKANLDITPIFKIASHENKTGAILTFGVVSSMSKMHHKFLVFFDQAMKPIGVWTGSYNFSRTSNLSLENGIYITDPATIEKYHHEFSKIYFHAEPYNWKSGILSKAIYGVEDLLKVT